MKRMALDYDGAVADLYWIRALQHFGRERLAPPEHSTNVRAAVSAAGSDDHAGSRTSASPIASARSSWASLSRRSGTPRSRHRAAEEGPGDAAAEVAVHAGPRVRLLLAPAGLSDGRRLVSAARPRSRARRRGCRRSPRSRSPRAAAERVARALAADLAKSEEPWLRDSAMQRLPQLDAMDAMDALDARVRDYRLKHPGAPLSWDALRAAGYVRGVPLDPSSTPFVFTPAGRDDVSRESKLLPLPGQIRGPRS